MYTLSIVRKNKNKLDHKVGLIMPLDGIQHSVGGHCTRAPSPPLWIWPGIPHIKHNNILMLLV